MLDLRLVHIVSGAHVLTGRGAYVLNPWKRLRDYGGTIRRFLYARCVLRKKSKGKHGKADTRLSEWANGWRSMEMYEENPEEDAKDILGKHEGASLEIVLNESYLLFEVTGDIQYLTLIQYIKQPAGPRVFKRSNSSFILSTPARILEL